MVVAYPSNLPQVSHQQYSESLPDNVIIEQMDSGPPQTRLRNSSPVAPVSFSWTLTETERQALRTFYNETCLYGSQVFQHTDFGGADGTFHYLFAEPPSFSHIGGQKWSCQVKLWKVAEL